MKKEKNIIPPHIEAIYNRIEKEKKERIAEINNSKMAEWEKKLALKAVNTSIWGF